MLRPPNAEGEGGGREVWTQNGPRATRPSPRARRERRLREARMELLPAAEAAGERQAGFAEVLPAAWNRRAWPNT
jgi:hypothetical protein